MSKELEALEKVYYGSQGYGETDKYYKFLKNFLESIDNANPSEALECVEEWKYQINSYIDCSLDCGDIDNECYNHLMDELEQYYTTIKQALLKQQELPEPFKTGVDIGVIKPKKYLKWEDLEFKENNQRIKVKLGSNIYTLDFYIGQFGKTFVLNLQHYCEAKDNIQFFNDLHLERVEE